jgi:hypothetical protein
VNGGIAYVEAPGSIMSNDDRTGDIGSLRNASNGGTRSALPEWNVRSGGDCIAKFPKCRATNFWQTTDQAAIVDRWRQTPWKPPVSLPQNEVVPHINIRSPHPRPGKFVIGNLLQSEHAGLKTDAGFRPEVSPIV